MVSSGGDPLLQTAQAIVTESSRLAKLLSDRSIAPPSLSVGASCELWTAHDGEMEAIRSALLGLTQRLDMLVQGPHDFLHEYVSLNWEYGALYTLLQFDVLEEMPLDGTSVPVSVLAQETGLPSEKLRPMCRLVACAGILRQMENDCFAHTVISEELVRDRGFKSFAGFQLFETRVANAHLADSLRKPNPFWTGQAAFDYAWGMPMYEWHRKHPDKGKRFGEAMESVSQTLDPANSMIIDFLAQREDMTSTSDKSSKNGKALLIDVSGKATSLCRRLATIFPNMQFETQYDSQNRLRHLEQAVPPELVGRVTFRERGEHAAPYSQQIEELDSEQGPTIFLVHTSLWSLDDNACIETLREFVPALRHRSRPLLVISDLVSPAWGSFEPHVERAYRRRDVALMTMHNAKQRTAKEWDNLIREACSTFKVTYSERCSSHSCRGLWVIQMAEGDEDPVDGVKY